MSIPMRSSDVAVFVAGDKNIFFPALVALTSIKRQNPHRFDLYMCFEGSHLTHRMRAMLDMSGIQFMDTSTLEALPAVRQMKKMDGWWPLEVYLNWAMPEYFARLGYSHAIKADYDILCIAPYEDDLAIRYLAPGQPCTAIATGADTKAVTKATASVMKDKMGLSPEHKKGVNVGFVLFDLGVCAHISFFEMFMDLHNILSAQTPRIPLDEQVVAAILMNQLGEGVIYLDERYNMRVRRSPVTGSDLVPDIANIHYITAFKPWRPLTPDDMRRLGKTIHPIVPLYRNFWIRFAQTIPFCEDFVTEQPLTDLQLIGAIAAGTRGVQDAIKALKADAEARKPR